MLPQGSFRGTNINQRNFLSTDTIPPYAEVTTRISVPMWKIQDVLHKGWDRSEGFFGYGRGIGQGVVARV